MTAQGYMLDTDTLIFMVRGLKIADSSHPRREKAERIRSRIREHQESGANVAVSMVTVCELEYGAAKSARPERERRAVSRLLAPFALLECDAVQLPRKYGEIRAELEKKGAPIGAMDLMIAAHACTVGAILVTNNETEFGRVNALVVENWSR